MTIIVSDNCPATHGLTIGAAAKILAAMANEDRNGLEVQFQERRDYIAAVLGVLAAELACPVIDAAPDETPDEVSDRALAQAARWAQDAAGRLESILQRVELS